MCVLEERGYGVGRGECWLGVLSVDPVGVGRFRRDEDLGGKAREREISRCDVVFCGKVNKRMGRFAERGARGSERPRG